MSWSVSGTYYEACNCEAVCPCRRQGERTGGRSTYGRCDFVLSWMVEQGDVDGRDLSELAVVMVGSYSDDEPGAPWRVVLFVDETADEVRRNDLSDVFLGRLGGDTDRLYGRLVAEVSMVRPASIQLVHERTRWRIGVSSFVEVRSTLEALTTGPVTCGISNHLPGSELISDIHVVAAPPFAWDIRRRCAFASRFAYTG